MKVKELLEKYNKRMTSNYNKEDVVYYSTNKADCYKSDHVFIVIYNNKIVENFKTKDIVRNIQINEEIDGVFHVILETDIGIHSLLIDLNKQKNYQYHKILNPEKVYLLYDKYNGISIFLTIDDVFRALVDLFGESVELDDQGTIYVDNEEIENYYVVRRFIG